MSAQQTRVAHLLPWTPVSLILLLIFLATSPPAKITHAQSPESDVSAAVAKDENPGDGIPWDLGIDNDADTLIDEDSTADGVDDDGDGADGEDPSMDVVKAGEPQLIPVRFTFTAGAIADTLTLTATIAGPSACDPRWAAQSEQLSVTVLGPLQLSQLIWRGESFAPGAEQTIVRSYSVSCPEGAHPFNIVAHAASETGLADPQPLNNLAENELFVAATADVDADGIPNPLDGCDWIPDSGADTDNDGVGDVCDMDDDDDGFSDETEGFVGTDPLRACASTPVAHDESGPDAWPPDFTDDGLVNVGDALAFKAVLLGLAPYDPRFDLDTNGVINIGDVGVVGMHMTARCYGS